MTKQFFKSKHPILLQWIALILFSLLRDLIVFRELQFSPLFSFTLLINSIISGGYTLLLLSFPLFVFKWSYRKYYLMVGIVPVLSNLFNYIHLFQYKTPITMGAFAVIFETTPGEATEFFNLITPGYLIISLLLSLLPYSLLFFIPKREKGQKLINLIFIGGVFLFSTMLAGITETVRAKKWHYSHHSFEHSFIYNDAKRVAYYFRERRKLNNIREMRSNISIEAKQPSHLDTIPQTYILVLGESMAKGHMGLYGYYRNTTPNMDTLSNLYKFDDVIAPATQTRTAMMMLLTPATTDELDRYYSSESIINVANKAGFKSWWISNQMMFGISDTETSVIAKDAHVTTFVNTDWNTNSLDERMLEPLKTALHDPATRKLIILHMLGSHHAYNKRFPNIPPFIVTDSLINPGHWNQHQKQLVQEYNNSIRYSDYVLSEVIKQLKELSHPASLIFLSDHGQEIFDRPGLSMGHGSPRLVREVTDVPFWIWFNNHHIQNADLKSQFPSEYLLRPYSLENLFHTTIDFMHIETNSLNPLKSLFNSEFQPSTRKILNSAGDLTRYEEVTE